MSAQPSAQERTEGNAEADMVNEKETSSEVDEEPDHVDEGYITWFKAMFEWSKAADPFYTSVIQTLLRPEHLVMPEHPLRSPEEEGIVLYHVIGKDDKERLCFSLVQIEYLQYYVLEYQKTDPLWLAKVGQLGFRSALQSDPESDECKEIAKQLEDAVLPEHLPLPSEWYLASKFKSIEAVSFVTGSTIKSLNKRLSTRNKQVAKRQLLELMSEEAKVREAARADNDIPGPGLRSGGQRYLNARSGQGTGDDDRSDTPPIIVSSPPRIADPPPERSAVPADPIPAPAEDAETAVSPVPGASTPAASDSDTSETPNVEMDEESSLLVDQLLQAREAAGDAARPPSPSEPIPKPPGLTFSVAYHQHAQQAVSVAGMGGVTEVLKQGVESVRPQGASQSSSGANIPDSPAGRSLFLALDVVTWEDDPTVVLEVGWAALWWQKNPENAGDEEYSLTEDCGHLQAQEYMLSKRNSASKSDLQDKYLFGRSLPVSEKDLSQVMAQIVESLQRKAGGGPTYIIGHSTGKSPLQPGKIGLGSGDLIASFHPPGWDYPTFADTRAVGQTFKIDTAMLFVAAEFGDKPPVPLRTSKSLAEVVKALTGENAEGVGNSGNDAFYTMQVFQTLSSANPLSQLREAVQSGRPVDWKANIVTAGPEQGPRSGLSPEWQDMVKAIEVLRKTGRLDEQAIKQAEADEDEDAQSTRSDKEAADSLDPQMSYDWEEDYSEDEMIGGVGYDDEDGNMVFWVHPDQAGAE